MRLRREQHHSVRDAEGRRELHQPRDLGAGMLTAGASDDREHQVSGGLRVGPVRLRHRLRERADRDVRTLVGLQAAHEQREPEAGQVEPRPRLGPIGRDEDRMVDAGRNDPDPLRIGAVEADELPRLLGRRREDPVGLADHPLLAPQAFEGLRRLTSSEGVVLDLAERVERGNERHTEDVLGRPPDPAGQPVVAVDDVVAVALLASDAEDPAEELRQVALHRGLRDRLARTGLGAHHADARRDLADLVGRSAPAPGEQVHLDPLAGEALGHGADVDVHPAGVTGPRLIDGRGVHGEHGDAGRSDLRAHSHLQPPTGPRFIPKMLRGGLIVGGGAVRRLRRRPAAPRPRGRGAARGVASSRRHVRG